MTTAAGGTGVRPAGARQVHRAPARLRIVGRNGRLQWWHGAFTLGCTLAGAMIGALVGMATAFLEVGVQPVVLLEAYGATAGFGAAIGLVVGLVLGLLGGLVDRFLLPKVIRPQAFWRRWARDQSRSSS